MENDRQSILEVAERIGGMIAARNLPVLVIGAVALAAHRYVRFTKDIDLGVLADLSGMRSIVEALRSDGYDAEFHEPDATDPLGGVIDVSGPFGLVQIISFEDRFPAVIRDALETDEVLSIRPGSSLRIMPIPHLVALKLYAGDHKSRADILELLRRNPEQDIEVIRKTCRKYRLRGLGKILKDL
jgi:hypothetical protein